MIGLDTNVLVRYLTQDEPVQSAQAKALINGLTVDSPGYVSSVALVETLWVLARTYEKSKAALVRVVEGFLQAEEIFVEDAAIHHRALAAYKAGKADYSDAVIAQAGQEARCQTTVTFDLKASATPGMTLLTAQV